MTPKTGSILRFLTGSQAACRTKAAVPTCHHPQMTGSAGPRVLVVEDDQMVRAFLRRALERGGLGVDEAIDGAGTLDRLLADDPPEAVLLDGLLPDMHGVVLARRLLDDPRNAGLPICFLTGAVQRRTVSTAGISCLAKPVRPTELVDEIETLLEWARAGGSPLEERRAALEQLGSGFLVGP